MADKQLRMLAEWEQEKANQCGKDYQLAQQNAQLQQQKLAGLEQYRLDYLRQTQSQGRMGLQGQSFNQYQSFIGKLDKACELQVQTHSQAVLVAQQRKDLWLQQQKKCKAVELLLEKKRLQREQKANKQAQSLSDEWAMQSFIRRQSQA